MDYILAKVFNNSSYAEGFLNGKIYMNPLTSFGIANLFNPKEDMSNKYRGDLNEGLRSNIPVNHGNLHNTIPFFSELDGLPSDITLVGELDSQFLDEHALSLFALYFDTEQNTFIKPDPRMMDFSRNKDTNGIGPTVVITKPQEFLKRVVATVSQNMGTPFWMGYGLVNYTLSDDKRAECDEFTKSKEYAWQQEFRIAIDLGSPKFYVKTNQIGYDEERDAIIIDIGDIRDIAVLISTESFVNLDLSGECNYALAQNPAPICPFYPPVKNKTTYACPVFKSGDTLYLSQTTLYPIVRDSRDYRIHAPFAEKSRNMCASKDALFIISAEAYFSRHINLYIANSCNEELGALLTVMVHYMLMLNIRELAGMYLRIEQDAILPVFHGLTAADTSLMTFPQQYQSFIRKKFKPINTDFAELVSISDDKRFDEYEYQGERFIRIVPNQDAVLSSGKIVKKGEAVWLSVSKVKWFVAPE